MGASEKCSLLAHWASGFQIFFLPCQWQSNVIILQHVLASSIDFIPNLFLFVPCRTLLEKQGASDELLATVGDDINVSHRVIMHSLQINWLQIISWVVGNSLWALQSYCHPPRIAKGWTIRKVMGGGGGGEFLSRRNFFRYQITCINFFLAVAWILFWVNWRAWIFFLDLIFHCVNIFCVLRPLPHKFSNTPSLILANCE